MFLIRQIFALVILSFLIECGGPIRNFSYQIRPDSKAKLKEIKTIRLRTITCKDTMISKSIRNLIVQEFLPSDIKLSDDSITDANIDLTITLVSDMAGGGDVIATQGFAGGSFSNSSGSYVSGINAQIFIQKDIIASATVSQSRTDSGVPDPPEEIARIMGLKLICILKSGVDCEYY
jgi:hypothetical protein